MASERSFRPSGARATLIAIIAVVSVLAFLTAAVSAQSGCLCSKGGGTVYRANAYCYTTWPPKSNYRVKYPIPVNNYHWNFHCQKKGDCWWNRIQYGNYWCYVNDWYMQTGCPDNCNNVPSC